MKKGEMYSFKDYDGMYKKVEFYRDSEFYDSLTGKTNYSVEYIIHSPAKELYNRGLASFEYFMKNSRGLSRDTRCWKCKNPIDELTYKICPFCGGIECPNDQVCLCGYVKETKIDNKFFTK